MALYTIVMYLAAQILIDALWIILLALKQIKKLNKKKYLKQLHP
jgi:hypothetical protein